jgi:hypothetical protein
MQGQAAGFGCAGKTRANAPTDVRGSHHIHVIVVILSTVTVAVVFLSARAALVARRAATKSRACRGVDKGDGKFSERATLPCGKVETVLCAPHSGARRHVESWAARDERDAQRLALFTPTAFIENHCERVAAEELARNTFGAQPPQQDLGRRRTGKDCGAREKGAEKGGR